AHCRSARYGPQRVQLTARRASSARRSDSGSGLRRSFPIAEILLRRGEPTAPALVVRPAPPSLVSDWRSSVASIPRMNGQAALANVKNNLDPMIERGAFLDLAFGLFHRQSVRRVVVDDRKEFHWPAAARQAAVLVGAFDLLRSLHQHWESADLVPPEVERTPD